ncbi:S-adenosylmethionine synthetase [Candidatus Mancarchaeum acidiphilum]|uniref:S-adenosylmethionine synthetase n=1 Tax=Candidatus Mancarchaeum acidiphilum TaxID=1920749 RepID=A0A218NMY7_9ARCH|nr:methionine adenosyltransferase [Candidatus Mancarchaeum acidiphilum]ASI13835.1 S-adenosylmethionine synthetase [Candidatus Mancarchaeum acidiphilum]
MGNIRVSESQSMPLYNQPVEYVERKGIGHPDSLIDGIMDSISMALSNAYLDEFGEVLHHNVDKGLIIGGSSNATFGSAEITRPIEIIMTGRATQEYNGTTIPVDQIAIDTAKDYLRKHTRFLDVDNEVNYVSKIIKGSSDLNNIFKRGIDMPLANDTSFGVGFAPFTTVERLVLETEHLLNSDEYKAKKPAVGEDVKVMGVRDGNEITLTVAIAFVSQFISSLSEYTAYKEEVTKDIIENASRITDKKINVVVNNGDDTKGSVVYLTKSGLSCESGDDGSVGRGNRVNGLITPFRMMSLEAAAGKNPVNHIGKIYNILANELANDIVRDFPQVTECNISIVSQIGRPINDPKHLNVSIATKKKEDFAKINKKVNELAQEELDNIVYLTKGIIAGEHKVF